MAQWSFNLGDMPGIGYEHTQDPWLTQRQVETQIGAEQFGITEQRLVDQFNQNLEHQLALSQAQEAAATKRAQIAASAQTGAAGIYAEADIRAAELAAAEARYRSDTLMKIAQLDNATKLQIAQEANKIEAMKWEATRFQHPSKWAEQEAWFAAGGAPAIETPTRSVVPQMPSGAGVTAAAPQAPPSYWPQAEGAIVGDYGPEIATVTPQGTQFTPVSPNQAMQLKQSGVPSMQSGGMLPSPDFHYWGGAKAPTPFKQGQGPQVDYMTGRGWLAGGTPTRGIDVSQGVPTGVGIWPGYSQRIRQRGAAAAGGGGWTGGPPRGGGRGGGGAGGGGGTAGGGAAGGGGTGGGEITPSVLSYLRGEEPYPGWGGQQIGQFQIPGGVNYGDVPLPGSINLVEFLNLPYDMQQMYISATEATYSMTPQTTMQGMTYFAPRGIAQPVAVWG